MTTRDVLLLLFGFLLSRGVDALAEWWASRHRPGVFPRNYRDICGPRCQAKTMSDKGWRVRTEAAIDRAAARIHRAVKHSR